MPAVLIVDERGKKAAIERGLVEQLLLAGNAVLAIDVCGVGETADTVPRYSGAHDYNLCNYAMQCGRSITGMRVLDSLAAVDFLSRHPRVDAERISCFGRGHGGLVGVLAAALDERISAVVAEEMLATWVFPEEFANIGMAYMIPRILTVGDMPHLMACVAPRPLLVTNPVDGQRRPIDATDACETMRFTQGVYGLLGKKKAFRVERHADEATPKQIVTWHEKRD